MTDENPIDSEQASFDMKINKEQEPLKTPSPKKNKHFVEKNNEKNKKKEEKLCGFNKNINDNLTENVIKMNKAEDYFGNNSFSDISDICDFDNPSNINTAADNNNNIEADQSYKHKSLHRNLIKSSSKPSLFGRKLSFTTSEMFSDNESDYSKELMDSMEMDETNEIRKNLEKNNMKNNGEKVRKKITKEDLDVTPLPVFECIFCCNEKIAFGHLIKENLEGKYMFMSSVFDMKELERIINTHPILDKWDKNSPLIDIIVKYQDYLHFYYNLNSSLNFFKSDKFAALSQNQSQNCPSNFSQKIEFNFNTKRKEWIIKNANKIQKNCAGFKLFNNTNSIINNINTLSGFVDNTSLSFNNNEIAKEINNNNNCVGINPILENSVEDIEKNSEGSNNFDDKDEIFDIFKFDLSRKITKSDYIWETRPFDIWNPVFDINYKETNEILETEEDLKYVDIEEMSDEEKNECFNRTSDR